MAEESSGILSRLADIATGKAQKDAISNSSVGELAKALGESMGEKFKSVQEAMAKLSSKGDSKEAVKAVEAGNFLSPHGVQLFVPTFTTHLGSFS